MLLIGCNVTFNSKDQLFGSTKEAISYGCNCFMFYTGAPQNTKRCELSYDLTKSAIDLMYENNIDLKNVVIHAPYIINLANNEKKDSYAFAISFLKEEIKRASMLGIKKIILHPGSYVNLDINTGINNIINALNEVILENQDVVICLETMAGKGTEIGYDINHLKTIIEGVKFNDKIMVCLDTCHLNDAGYDMSNFDSFLDYFDKKIGIEKIGCIHVNDSKNTISSHKDRHENIGVGYIGFNNLLNILYNKKLENIPKILETPFVSTKDGLKDRVYPPYKFEIDMIKDKKYNNNLYDDIRNYYKK